MDRDRLRASDFALALVGFVHLVVWKAPPWMVVVLTASTRAAFAFIGFQGRMERVNRPVSHVTPAGVAGPGTRTSLTTPTSTLP